MRCGSSWEKQKSIKVGLEPRKNSVGMSQLKEMELLQSLAKSVGKSTVGKSQLKEKNINFLPLARLSA